MTKEELIKKRYPFYNPNVYGKDIEICGESVMELMDEYAKQEAIKFKHWTDDNAWIISSEGIDGEIYYIEFNVPDKRELSQEQLYELYKQSK